MFINKLFNTDNTIKLLVIICVTLIAESALMLVLWHMDYRMPKETISLKTNQVKMVKVHPRKISGKITPDFDVTKNKFLGKPKDIDKHLSGGVLEGKGKAFLDAQEKYGINALFLVAITAEESAVGKSRLAYSNNNVAGMRAKGGYIYFETPEQCVDRLGYSLRHYYVNRGRRTISDINKLYATNTHWASKVSFHMNRLNR